jgi:hypothetical protein
MASQLLDILAEDDGYLGGCIIYENSVLATQLDEEILKWLIYRISLMVLTIVRIDCIVESLYTTNRFRRKYKFTSISFKA